MKSIFQEKARVLNNTRMGAAYGRISLQCTTRYLSAKPGQFVTVHTDNEAGPLLRRPFSIHRLISIEQDALCLEILYKIVGPGTEQMARLRPGARVDILGPLGNGFTMENGLKRVVLAGGGIGIAPLLFLASALHAMKKGPAEATLFAGGRSESDLLCLDEFADFGITVHISTDDGSAGEKGFLTRPLEAAIQEEQPDIIYACGPMGMLTCVAGIAKKQAVPCQVSIETIMACGMGACLGCAIEGASPDAEYLHVCLDGPVFDARCLRRQPGI
jgi:dihydroorotate dehydrogenase electron transfer subunit